MSRRLPCALSVFLAAALAAQNAAPALRTFRNLTGTFQIDLPANWRQLAPNEARRIADRADAPAELRYVEPRLFYAVGPVDEWLAGRFDGAWLRVVEQENEWLVGDDLDGEVAPQLRAMWQKQGAASGVKHELAAIRRENVGPTSRGVITARRTTVAPGQIAETTSLDVHAPAGGQQFSLSFTCRSADFDRMEPEFRRWIATLTFARAARGTPKLSDRLWTPILTGGAVGLVLLLLYKHLHRPPAR